MNKPILSEIRLLLLQILEPDAPIPAHFVLSGQKHFLYGLEQEALQETVLSLAQGLWLYTCRIPVPGSKGFGELSAVLSQGINGLSCIHLHCSLDIPEQIEELKKERQRFRIAIENTPVLIFEYDIESDICTTCGTLETGKRKHEQLMERVIEGFVAGQIEKLAAPESVGRLAALVQGKSLQDAELRVAVFFGSTDYVWARITTTPIFDGKGNLLKTIGRIISIQSEKEKEFALEEAKTRDNLTGLYNKEAGIRLVQDYMEKKSPEQVCGLMLFDMDGFDAINREEGTVFADAVLQDVADILRSETGPQDIQIRLGGDEFMIFVKDCDKARATILGPRIASMIRSLTVRENLRVPVSASVGMCVTAVVDEYSGLYRCAESTLKYVKENGKGRAACYLDTSNELGTMLTQIYTEKHFINEIDHPAEYREEDLISFALELLGKSKNLDDALSLLLSRVGKTYSFDRVSILEADHDFLNCRFTYQWAKNKRDIFKEAAHFKSLEQYRHISALYDEDGLSEVPISEELPEISSFPACLHGAIWDGGAYAGSLLFEVRESACWTPEQKKLIKELAKVIFSFLLKARADAVSHAKTDFLSRISHEIRTPMNAISGMTTIAKTVAGNRDKVLDCLTKIETANAYLLNLINDVLSMSRIESGKVELFIESIDFLGYMESLEALMRPQAKEKGVILTIENRFLASRPIMGDALRLNQVLINILSNAIKFTDSGGRVNVLIEPLRRTEEDVLLRFSISDTGIGISREAMGRIFNAFEQAGNETVTKYGGTGLGLSISSRLVQMMGGALEVRSEVMKGSHFYFTLLFPFGAVPSEAPLEERKLKRLHTDLKGKRILLAEDNALNMEIAAALLEMKGLLVETAVNGKEAVDLFGTREPYTFDGILMDIRMPVLDGLEATKQIRTLGKPDSHSIPIIAMTANAFDEDTKKSMESGMDGHLTKPIDVEQLFDMLQALFAKRKNKA